MSVTKSPLFLLRQRTRLAYNLCREALVKYDNDVDKAEAWLQAESMRLGWQKASKLQSRLAREGLIGLAVHSNKRVAAMVEINCETDFVAKNTTFQTFAQTLVQKIVTNLEQQYSTEQEDVVKQKLVKRFALADEKLTMFNDDLVPIISKMGENVRLGRAALFTSMHPSVGLYGDVHGSLKGTYIDGADNNKPDYNIQTGRFASIIGLQFLDNQTSRLTDDTSNKIATRLCKHIIGYDPSYIEMPEAIREKLLEAQKAAQAQAEEEKQMKNVENNSEENDEDEVPYVEEPPSMLDQTLIMSNDNQKVGQYCDGHKIKIVDIHRFECGQV